MITGSKIPKDTIRFFNMINNEGECDLIGYSNLRLEDGQLTIRTYELPNEIEFKNCELVNFKIVFIKETFREKLKRYFKIIKSKL